MKVVEECCSFCRKTKSECKGKFLITSKENTKYSICVECVQKANKMLEEKENEN